MPILPTKTCSADDFKGFSLTEVLIALGLMGVLAAFTIPKVLSSMNSNAYNAKAKEVVVMVQTAYSNYQEENVPTATTFADNLTPFMNYVKRVTNTTIDAVPGSATINCANAWERCYLMKNGSTLRMLADGFGGTETTNALEFNIDPDSKVTGSQSGQSVGFTLYYDGIVRVCNNRRTPTYTQFAGPYGSDPNCQPSWFSWEK